MVQILRRTFIGGAAAAAGASLVGCREHAPSQLSAQIQRDSQMAQGATAIRRGYAQIPEGLMHYFEAGKGAPLLLLHPCPRSARSFRALLPLLATHCRAIALDIPGFGQSDPLSGEITMERLAAAVVRVLDVLGIDRAHVFGLHTGNKVGAAMAASHAGRVNRLILCGSIHSIIPDKTTRDAAIRAIVSKYFTQYPESPNGEQYLRRWFSDWADLCSIALPTSLYAKSPITPEDIADVQARVLDHVQALQSVVATYGANFAFDFGAAIERISSRTLILELVMPHEEKQYGRQLGAVCARIRSARGATLENRDGSVVERHPAEVARQIIEFLGEP